MTQTTQSAMPVSPQPDAVQLWLCLGRLYAELQQAKTDPERNRVRERVRELVRDIGKVGGASAGRPTSRGLLQSPAPGARDGAQPGVGSASHNHSSDGRTFVPGRPGYPFASHPMVT
jgi:hypothetical protein